MLSKILALTPMVALALAGVAGAAPGGNTAKTEMRVSVEVVRSCTVQPSGKTAAVACGSSVPSTMRIGTPQPAPQSTTTGDASGSQVVTIEF